MSCEVARQRISEADGRLLAARKLRARLRACEGCRDFRAAIRTRKSDLEALAPPLPASAAAAVLAGLLAGGPGAKLAGGAGLLGSSATLNAAVAGIATIAIGGAAVAVNGGVPGISGGLSAGPGGDARSPSPEIFERGERWIRATPSTVSARRVAGETDSGGAGDDGRSARGRAGSAGGERLSGVPGAVAQGGPAVGWQQSERATDSAGVAGSGDKQPPHRKGKPAACGGAKPGAFRTGGSPVAEGSKMTRKTTFAVAGIAALALTFPSAAVGHIDTAVSSVRAHTDRADSALDRAVSLFEANRNHRAREALTTSRRQIGKARREATQLRRQADRRGERTPRGRSGSSATSATTTSRSSSAPSTGRGARPRGRPRWRRFATPAAATRRSPCSTPCSTTACPARPSVGSPARSRRLPRTATRRS